MKVLSDTPDRLVLQQGAGRGPVVIFAIVVVVFLVGFIVIATAPSSGMPIVLSVGGALMVLFALAWAYILAVATHTTEITFDRRADSITFRHRAVLRARHDTIRLSQITGVAVERAERHMRQDDPQTGKRRRVLDVAYRPVLLTEAEPVPLFSTFTNEDTAKEPARAVLHWLLGEDAPEPPLLDSQGGPP
ncbi:hypothetical protein FHY55_17735 [Oceanicola sp. D3]|uniref:hypothetical protein n=1 Tax=Oceanicola sp. D3 TaxID=2587163 RepID=UPI0011237E99|nr:hypothetical protein [Oceanicola sp. D3]QDC10960.1 hypothetical protein FHY55_17735 [Oceanicola sp. D3]